MDEAVFDFDQQQALAVGRRFPARRLDPPRAQPSDDIRDLAAEPDFCQHAWDEGGH